MAEHYNAVQFSLDLLKLVGFYTKENSIKDRIPKLFFCGMLLFVNCSVIIQFWYIRDIDDFVYNAEAVGAFMQILLKMIFAVYNQDKLDKLLNGVEFFWMTDLVTTKLKSKLNNFIFSIVRAQKFFAIVIVVCALIIDTDSLVYNSLPLGSWNADTPNFWFYLTWISEVAGLVVGCIFVPALDNIFLAVSTNIIVQFRILSHLLNHLFRVRKEQPPITIKFYIEHHIFLLKFVESMQEYFSVILLIQYLTTTPLIVGEMYMLFESNTAYSLIRHGFICVGIILQFSFYCITAECLSAEAETVAEAIYSSNWYMESSPSLRRSIALIIQRAQRKIVFRANGLIDINISMLVAVLQVSWSTCNIAKAIKN